MPCFENTCVTNASAMSMAVAVSVLDMKMHSFDSQSMTTSVVVKPFDSGSSLMKSMLIECHGHSSIGSSCRRPYGQCQDGLLCTLSMHCAMKFLQLVCMLGHM
jgi:hypothetical protein